MKKVIYSLMALMISFSSLNAVAEVNLNLDLMYSSWSYDLESGGTTTTFSNDTLRSIVSLYFVELSSVKLGAAYYGESNETSYEESIMGLALHYGEDYFIEVIAGPYKQTQAGAADDLTGIGLVLIPGKLFKLGGSIDFRFSLPIRYAKYENDAGTLKYTELAYVPFVGIQTTF